MLTAILAEQAFEIVAELVANAFNNIPAQLKKLEKDIAELSYKEAMEYFVIHKHDSPSIDKGAMLKKPGENGTGFIIIQTFLDNNNAIVCDSTGKPLGHTLRVKRLDTELQTVFKQNALVLVE